MVIERAALAPKKKSGLGLELILCFLALSLIPMTTVGGISYRTAYSSLFHDAVSSLKSVIQLKTAYISSSFNHAIKTLNQQSQQEANIKFLQELRAAHQTSKKPLGDFITGYQARKIVHEQSSGLRNFQKNFNYYDILLIDVEGNILFTVKEEDDLGTNLFHGAYSGTLFAAAVREALQTGRVIFSDYERFAPSGNKVAGFLVEVMLDDNGDKAGIMAIQLSMDMIDQIMQMPSGLGKTEDIFLVGTDLRRRSNDVREKKETVLGEPVDTMQTRLWKEHHVDADVQESYTAEIYQGHHGEPVFGIHGNFKIAGVHLGVIAELDAVEAFAPANRLRDIIIVLLITTGIVVITSAFLLASRIVSPITYLSKGVRRVADGDLTREVRVLAGNEIGELADGFNEMLASLRLATAENEQRNWLATGQAGLDSKMRGNLTMTALAEGIISYVVRYVDAPFGTLFINTGEDIFALAADFACNFPDAAQVRFRMGEGLVGQAAKDRQMLSLTDIPDDFITVISGLGEAKPKNIHVIPCGYDDKIIAVLEIASFTVLSGQQVAFLRNAADSIAISINMASSRAQLEEVLSTTRQQAAELEAQQEELQAANEELLDKARR